MFLVIHKVTYPQTQRNKQPPDTGTWSDNRPLNHPDLEDPPIYGAQQVQQCGLLPATAQESIDVCNFKGK